MTRVSRPGIMKLGKKTILRGACDHDPGVTMRPSLKKPHQRRADRRYYLKHPTHKLLYGHRYRQNPAFQGCSLCGRSRTPKE
jgi:hypothetical protein